MRKVRVRIEGDVDCAIDLSNEDLLQMLRKSLPHELTPDTCTVEIVPLKEASEDGLSRVASEGENDGR